MSRTVATPNPDRKIHTLHIVLDLETASTQADAAVVAIGAVGFSLEFPEFIPREFYGHLHLADCEDRGLHICKETVQWWSEQDEEVRKESFKGPENSTSKEVLADFSAWYEEQKNEWGNVRIWGNGADFDCVILRNCLDAFDVKVPWVYREQRCLRTLLKLTPKGIKVEQPDHLKHHALWDARYEAANLRQLLNYLKSTGVDINEL